MDDLFLLPFSRRRQPTSLSTTLQHSSPSKTFLICITSSTTITSACPHLYSTLFRLLVGILSMHKLALEDHPNTILSIHICRSENRIDVASMPHFEAVIESFIRSIALYLPSYTPLLSPSSIPRRVTATQYLSAKFEGISKTSAAFPIVNPIR